MWRLSDAGPRARVQVEVGQHPKPVTQTDNPHGRVDTVSYSRDI
jgi:hypothetical protein